ncbi:hypothetical protein [Lactococcus lactis]|uniref:Uncharacterized protein n=1 Tax=Lactococcus lactis TaxID=1358 RepID=A0AAP3Z2M4_9LACT|nr:hypothetical protein [Lactococcus lactis]MDG4969294.1 hypothetical protein [Lactococcus lactis]MDG4977225.1 hypothetical protein [Lactococcus lactis]MDG5103389.1 hypothetical protein [Lactococcus lactis]TNU78284.1 hypothetical protein FIB48_09645 [Lactococcus lactis subsp. lactis]
MKTGPTDIFELIFQSTTFGGVPISPLEKLKLANEVNYVLTHTAECLTILDKYGKTFFTKYVREKVNNIWE